MRRISSQVEVIRNRWADCSWPNIGYFVHGQARLDIAELLAEIDRVPYTESKMQNDEAEDLWLAIEANLDDRGCFNGIDRDVMEELRADLIQLIREKVPALAPPVRGTPIL